MADSVEKTIYKLELDASGYIQGTEALSASTQKLTTAQERANAALKTNEAALKNAADNLERAKKDLDDYTGANERYRKQLEKSFKDASANQVKLTQLVANNRKEYELATKAAQDFANISGRATQLQQGTTGGKIPTGPAPGLRSPITPILNNVNEGDLLNILDNTTDEFEKLEIAIQIAEERMGGLNQEGEEFKLLAPIIKGAKEALEAFQKANTVAGDNVGTLTQQIKRGQNTLNEWAQAGKTATAEYKELTIAVAKLKNLQQDQAKVLQVLSSSTRGLDFGKAAVQSAISGFQAYSAVMILAGGENEKLQKRTMELFAAMQLLTALEQLSTQVKRGGVLITNLQSAAQATYTAVIGASTGALKAFRIALLASGIGIAVVAIGYLILKLTQAKAVLSEAAEKQKLLNSALEEAKGAYVKAVTEVGNLKTAFEQARSGIIKKEEAVKLYNETIGKTTGFVKTLDEAEKGLVKNAPAYIQFTLLKAAANIAAAKSAEKLFDATMENRKSREIMADGDLTERDARKLGKSLLAEDKLRKESANLLDIQKDFQDQANAIAKEFNFNPLGLDKPNDTKKIENVFFQKLKELQARLAGVIAKSFESEGTIRKQFAASLEKELFSIDELLKKKQLTSGQAGILKAIIKNISSTELEQALGVFRDKQKDALQKIQDSIDEAILDAGKQSVQNIRDEFEKEVAVIEQESSAALSQLAKKQAELFKQIDKDTESGLISKTVAKRKKFILTLVFGDLANEIEAAKATRQIELAYKQFEKLLEDISSRASEGDVLAAERLAELVRDERDKLEAGLISFKEFQDSVTKITKEAANVRKEIRRAELQQQLDALNISLEASDDPQIIARLKKRQLEIRLALANLDTEAAGGVDDPDNPKERFQDYAVAIGELTQSIISFWQKANEAESQALDKSISLQEKRVEAARRIAERGNAQYLKQEEDRLKELTVQRENAARRELAINAALQASQLLVGITGAISKLAAGPLGAAAVIGEIAIIVAALAAGYGLVKSLQGSQPKLAAGTKNLRRGNHPAGTDTIPAWLNEGEAVIPTHRNKEYHPTVAAIYDGTIPADRINGFVNAYHRTKSVPRPNYDRIKDAAELSISHDGRLLEELKENNSLQRQTLRAMKNMSVSASIDRNGVAIAVNEYVQQMEIDKYV